MITGPTTGALFLTLDEARVDLKPVDEVKKGQRVSFKVPEKIRPSYKLYKLVAPEDLKKKKLNFVTYVIPFVYQIVAVPNPCTAIFVLHRNFNWNYILFT